MKWLTLTLATLAIFFTLCFHDWLQPAPHYALMPVGWYKLDTAGIDRGR